MIRPIEEADTPALVALAESSGLFKSEELGAVREMLDGYHAAGSTDGRAIIAHEEDGRLLGMAYFAPKEFADSVWELYMIAVDASRQRQGIGSALLLDVERRVREHDARLLLIETSSRSDFERTRRFYLKHGYDAVAHIPDFFADGDGKASFLKRVRPR